MKVLKQPKIKKSSVRQKCVFCGTKLEIDFEDIDKEKGIPYYGFDGRMQFCCPICNKICNLNEKNTLKLKHYYYQIKKEKEDE